MRPLVYVPSLHGNQFTMASLEQTTPRKPSNITVCRVCGEDLKFGQRGQVFNLLLKEELKTALEAITQEPVVVEDVLKSVCLSCKQLLDKYSRTKDNLGKITNSVKELCGRNPARHKRCVTTSPTFEHTKKRRVSAIVIHLFGAER